MHSFDRPPKIESKEIVKEKYTPAHLREKLLALPEPVRKQLDLVLQNKHNLDLETVSNESTLAEITTEEQRTKLAYVIADLALHKESVVVETASKIAHILG